SPETTPRVWSAAGSASTLTLKCPPLSTGTTLKFAFASMCSQSGDCSSVRSGLRYVHLKVFLALQTRCTSAAISVLKASFCASLQTHSGRLPQPNGPEATYFSQTDGGAFSNENSSLTLTSSLAEAGS